MKKMTTATILFILLLFITGCGNTTSVYTEEREAKEIKKQEVVETKDIKVVETNEAEMEEANEEEPLLNSKETPCGAEEIPAKTEVVLASTKTTLSKDNLPNIEDYIEDNYFDIEGYFYDCGAEFVGSDGCGYVAVFPNWKVFVGSITYRAFPALEIRNSAEGDEKPYFYIPPQGEEESQWYHETEEVCIADSSIYKLPDLIYGLYNINFEPKNPEIDGFVYD